MWFFDVNIAEFRPSHSHLFTNWTGSGLTSYFLRFNYILKKIAFFMVNLGVIIVIGAVIGSMGIAMYMYSQYQTNFVTGVVGESIRVGPVEYIITFEGTFEGTKEVKPENTFVKIGIVAKNISNEETNLSGGQFFFIDGNKKTEATYGEFDANDLLFEKIEPNKPVQRTTQFDVEFDEEKQYKILIRPQKEQSTVDTASVCLVNC